MDWKFDVLPQVGSVLGFACHQGLAVFDGLFNVALVVVIEFVGNPLAGLLNGFDDIKGGTCMFPLSLS